MPFLSTSLWNLLVCQSRKSVSCAPYVSDMLGVRALPCSPRKSNCVSSLPCTPACTGPQDPRCLRTGKQWFGPRDLILSVACADCAVRRRRSGSGAPPAPLWLPADHFLSQEIQERPVSGGYQLLVCVSLRGLSYVGWTWTRVLSSLGVPIGNLRLPLHHSKCSQLGCSSRVLSPGVRSSELLSTMLCVAVCLSLWSAAGTVEPCSTPDYPPPRIPIPLRLF